MSFETKRMVFPTTRDETVCAVSGFVRPPEMERIYPFAMERRRRCRIFAGRSVAIHRRTDSDSLYGDASGLLGSFEAQVQVAGFDEAAHHFTLSRTNDKIQ